MTVWNWKEILSIGNRMIYCLLYFKRVKFKQPGHCYTWMKLCVVLKLTGAGIETGVTLFWK